MIKSLAGLSRVIFLNFVYEKLFLHIKMLKDSSAKYYNQSKNGVEKGW